MTENDIMTYHEAYIFANTSPILERNTFNNFWIDSLPILIKIQGKKYFYNFL